MLQARPATINAFRHLRPPTTMASSQRHLVTCQPLSSARLGPVGSIAVSIEWAASIDKEHGASRIVAEIKGLVEPEAEVQLFAVLEKGACSRFLGRNWQASGPRSLWSLSTNTTRAS